MCSGGGWVGRCEVLGGQAAVRCCVVGARRPLALFTAGRAMAVQRSGGRDRRAGRGNTAQYRVERGSTCPILCLLASWYICTARDQSRSTPLPYQYLGSRHSRAFLAHQGGAGKWETSRRSSSHPGRGCAMGGACERCGKRQPCCHAALASARLLNCRSAPSAAAAPPQSQAVQGLNRSAAAGRRALVGKVRAHAQAQAAAGRGSGVLTRRRGAGARLCCPAPPRACTASVPRGRRRGLQAWKGGF